MDISSFMADWFITYPTWPTLCMRAFFAQQDISTWKVLISRGKMLKFYLKKFFFKWYLVQQIHFFTLLHTFPLNFTHISTNFAHFSTNFAHLISRFMKKKFKSLKATHKTWFCCGKGPLHTTQIFLQIFGFSNFT